MEEFLSPDLLLIYVDNITPFADVRGTTCIAKQIKNYISGDVSWYDVIILSDEKGNPISFLSTISGDRVVSNRSKINVVDNTFTAPFDESRGFVLCNLKNPFSSVSRTSLGSGIF